MAPDGNRTIAAAMFGAVIFAPPKKAKEGEEPKGEEGEDYGTTVLDDVNVGANNPVAPRPTVNTIPAKPGQTWGEASHLQQESFCKAVSFLRSFVATQTDLSKVNKEDAAVALAATMKDSPMADLKPNYGLMVSIFLSVLQSIQ